MDTPKLLPSQIRQALQSAAKCDAIITSEDWLRTFSYEENWSDGIAMAKYDNGGGNHVFVFFTSDEKTLIKGFDHESAVSPHARDEYTIWPGIYDGLPFEFESLLKNEAIEYEDVTFCCWSIDGKTWYKGNAVIPDDIDDGSTWLLRMIQLNAEQFIEWARAYYGDSFEVIGEEGISKFFGSHDSCTSEA